MGRDLADQLLVGAEDGQPRGRLDPELDAFRRLDLDRMRVAEREDELGALQLGAVADAADLEALA